jgi:uncharacterized membrane protein
MLTLDEIDAQTAMELHDRELPCTALVGCIFIFIQNVNVSVPITISNNTVNVCIAAVLSACSNLP